MTATISIQYTVQYTIPVHYPAQFCTVIQIVAQALGVICSTCILSVADEGSILLRYVADPMERKSIVFPI